MYIGETIILCLLNLNKSPHVITSNFEMIINVVSMAMVY